MFVFLGVFCAVRGSILPLRLLHTAAQTTEQAGSEERVCKQGLAQDDVHVHVLEYSVYSTRLLSRAAHAPKEAGSEERACKQGLAQGAMHVQVLEYSWYRV